MIYLKLINITLQIEQAFFYIKIIYTNIITGRNLKKTQLMH